LKKIWFFTNSEPNQLDNYNVKLRRHGQLMQYLSENGYKVLCFTSNFSHFEKKKRTKFSQIKKINNNLSFFCLESLEYKKNISLKRYLNNLLLNFKIKKYIFQLDRPDVIVLSIPPVDSAPCFVDYAKKNNIPVISDFRDMWPDIINQTLTGILKFIFLPFYLNMNYNLKKIRNNSSYLISVSKGMLNWIINKNKKNRIEAKYIYLSHYIEKPFKLEKLNKDSLKIFYSGVISSANYMERFLDYTNNLPNYLKNKLEINIAGYGDLYEKCKNKKYKFVNFLGWLNKNQIKKISLESHFGLVTYKPRQDFLNNVPNKISEYLGYGLPVITTIGGESLSIMNEKNCAFFINMKSINHFNQSIQKIFNLSDQAYMNKRENCRLIFEKYFDSHKNIKIYKELIDHVTTKISK
jgi:glycosyltransferase involved in cell wall biosynthesis